MFLPGKSGNPNGAPPRDKRFSTLLRELLASNEIDLSYSMIDDKGIVVTKRLQVKSDKSLYHGLVVALISKGLNGEVPALTLILDRLEGKAEQPITFNPDEISFTPAFSGKPPGANEAPSPAPAA